MSMAENVEGGRQCRFADVLLKQLISLILPHLIIVVMHRLKGEVENGDEKGEEENFGKDEVDIGGEDYQAIDLLLETVWALKVTAIGRAGNIGCIKNTVRNLTKEDEVRAGKNPFQQRVCMLIIVDEEALCAHPIREYAHDQQNQEENEVFHHLSDDYYFWTKGLVDGEDVQQTYTENDEIQTEDDSSESEGFGVPIRWNQPAGHTNNNKN